MQCRPNPARPESHGQVARSWVPHAPFGVWGFDSSFIFFSLDDLPSRHTSAKLKPVRRSTSLTPATPRLPDDTFFAVSSANLKRLSLSERIQTT